MGSVEIDVVNENLLNIANTEETTKGGITYSIKNGILKLNGTATASFDIQLSKNIKIKKGKYKHSSSYIQSGLYISFDNLGYTMISATAGKKRTFEITEDTTYKTYFLWIDKGTVLNNVEIKLQLEVGDTATAYVEHQSQTITMPVQQEMLTGDYIADVEHHEWKKLIITGDEIVTYYDAPSIAIANNLNTAYFTINISERAQGNSNNIISNMFKNLYTASAVWGNASSTSENLKESIAVDTSIRLRINKNRLEGYDNSLTSNEKIVLLKTYLKSLYDAGNPVVVYYKLATPTNLQLTDEQKSALETQLNTYKNVTNINLSDELASVDISYKKDQNTVNNKLQSQINELKELLSTTQTSALLLDNLQKDIESEVG